MVIKNADQQKLADIANKKMSKSLLEGNQPFEINCQICHEVDANGIKNWVHR